MKKYLKFETFFITLILIFSAWPGFASSKIRDGYFIEPPEEFQNWQKKFRAKKYKLDFDNSDTNSAEDYGYIPLPVDLSHLDYNPPIENNNYNNNKFNFDKDSQLPSKYDVKNYVTSIKNQVPYGTCWAFAGTGAMESNYILKYGSTIDLSAMHLAYFAFVNPDKYKSFLTYTAKSDLEDILNNGGNAFLTTALYSRLDGPTLDINAPYPKKLNYEYPEDYQRALRLRDVFFMRLSRINLNSNSEQRNIVKKRIMQNGAVQASYYSSNSDYAKINGYSTYYNTATGTNHAILLVGWDDNFSKENFKIQPSSDGAWLIKNSWNKQWANTDGERIGDAGYFWMSYEQYLTDGIAFNVEEADEDLQCYYYDALGWCSTYGWDNATDIYSANVFKSERDDEKLIDVGFFTPDNNINYTIYVYTGISKMPSSTPINGSPIITQSGTIPYAGYHVVTLNDPVELTNGEYFSVVIKFDGYNETPTEIKETGFSDNAKIETGSFFSYNGTSWTTGAKIKANACIKAFTRTNLNAETEIITDSIPDALLNNSYAVKFSATGGDECEWTLTGNLPTGLNFTSNGYLYGTPTTTGEYEFTITAKNSYGSDSAAYILNVYDKFTITTAELYGTVSYTFSEYLEANVTNGVTWTANNTLPTGLKLNSSTGLISGTPKTAGTFYVNFTASHSLGTDTAQIIFIIDEKADKPKFTTTRFSSVNVGEYFSQDIYLTGTLPISLKVDEIPEGLNLKISSDDLSCYELFGSALKSGSYNLKFTAENRATNLTGSPVTKTIKLTVKDVAPKITSTYFPTGIKDVEYTPMQFKISGGTGDVIWSATGLPTGLKLSSTGLLSGTPLYGGNYKVKIKAKNSGGTDTLSDTLVILKMPEITTTSLKVGTSCRNYKYTIKTKGSTPLTSFDVRGLPEGLIFTPNLTKGTGVISGNSALAGTFKLNIYAENAASSDLAAIDLKLNGISPKIVLKTAYGKGSVGNPYSLAGTATGTIPIKYSYTLSESDLKKAGISGLDDLNLKLYSTDYSIIISGTPHRSVKSLPITLNAVNDYGTYTKRAYITVKGVAPTFIEPVSSSIKLIVEPSSVININFKVSGTTPISFTSTGTGNDISFKKICDTKGRLSGVAPSTETKKTINITAKNADGKASRKIIIQTKIPPKITTTSLDNAVYKKVYSKKIEASGSKTISWEITSGILPKGIKFNSKTGLLSGKPTVSGDYSFTVKAMNLMGTDFKKFVLTVKESEVLSKSAPTEFYNEAPPDLRKTEGQNSGSNNDGENNKELDGNKSGTQTSDDYITAQGIKIISSREISEVAGYWSERLAKNRLMIAGVLPEIEITDSGTYNFNLELDENISDGLKIYWCSNIENYINISGENENLILFYDESGHEISTIPENHKIGVSVWLETGIYSPVILAGENLMSSADVKDAKDVKTDGATFENNSSSGGCNLGFMNYFALFGLLILARKKKINK